MKAKRSVIPGIFTTMNLLSGFLAITKVADGQVIAGCWLVVFAAVFDLLDGKLARLTKSASEFGVEFDSLADVVSFGVAPSFLMYHIYFNQMGMLGMLISFSPLVAGAFRLARFNIQLVGFEKSNFAGLPIPIAAITMVSFVIFNYYFWDTIRLQRLVIPIVIMVCLLMVSNVEYYTTPKLTFRLGRRHSTLIVLMFTCLIIILFFPQEAMFPIFFIYVLWGLVRHLTGTVRNSKESEGMGEVSV